MLPSVLFRCTPLAASALILEGQTCYFPHCLHHLLVPETTALSGLTPEPALSASNSPQLASIRSHSELSPSACSGCCLSRFIYLSFTFLYPLFLLLLSKERYIVPLCLLVLTPTLPGRQG